MKQEEKDLLLKDLCARLPYRVKAYIKNWSKLESRWIEGIYTITSVDPPLNNIYASAENGCVGVILGHSDYSIEPYLFPLSSMTEEQKEIYCQLQERVIYNSKGPVTEDVMNFVNWCYENHLDINDLISKGLAINATKLGIYENKIIKKG